MNKKILIIFLLVLSVMALATVSYVSAEDQSFWGPKEGPRPEKFGERNQNMLEQMAVDFGINVEELKTYFEEGKKPNEIAEELGIDMEEMRAKHQEQMQEKMKEHLDSLVADGKITEEKAAKRLEHLGENKMGEIFGDKRGPRPQPSEEDKLKNISENN